MSVAGAGVVGSAARRTGTAAKVAPEPPHLGAPSERTCARCCYNIRYISCLQPNYFSASARTSRTVGPSNHRAIPRNRSLLPELHRRCRALHPNNAVHRGGAPSEMISQRASATPPAKNHPTVHLLCRCLLRRALPSRIFTASLARPRQPRPRESRVAGPRGMGFLFAFHLDIGCGTADRSIARTIGSFYFISYTRV